MLHDEETIFGYFARAFALSGYRSRAEFLSRLMGNNARIGMHGEIESNVSNFRQAMQYFGVPFHRSTLERHCIGAIGLPFCETKNRGKKILSAISQSNNGRWQSFGMANTCIKKTPSHCSVCTREDMQSLGYSYWRRTPQIRGVKMCPSHRVMLSDRCNYCRAPWDADLQPQESCSACGGAVPSGDPFDDSIGHRVLIRFAEGVEGVFTGRIRGPLTSQTIRRRILEILPNGRETPGRTLAKFFLESAGPDYLDELNLGITATDKIPWPTVLLAERTIYAEATAQLLIYSVLSADLSRESMFSADFPAESDWQILTSPIRLSRSHLSHRGHASRLTEGVTTDLFGGRTGPPRYS